MPYGWLAMVHGVVDTQRFGNESFTIDLHEVLKSFDLGAMGTVKARWRRLVFQVDVDWAKLSDDGGVGDSLVRYDVTSKVGWPRPSAATASTSFPEGSSEGPPPRTTRPSRST